MSVNKRGKDFPIKLLKVLNYPVIMQSLPVSSANAKQIAAAKGGTVKRKEAAWRAGASPWGIFYVFQAAGGGEAAWQAGADPWGIFYVFQAAGGGEAAWQAGASLQTEKQPGKVKTACLRAIH